MGLFPTDANDGDEVTNALGTVYKYNAADDKWYIINAYGILDEDNMTSDSDTDLATQ